jgi:hypothetical protein
VTRLRRRTDERAIRAVAWAAFALSLATRLYWVMRVQSPYAAVYSDMAGYVNRANALLTHAPNSFPRIDALYPYGTHYFYALVFGVFGFANERTVCVVQALLGAAPAWFFVRFAGRVFRGVAVPAALGALFAIWQPILWTTGFFLSEVPFIALLFWNSWLALRFAEARRGGLLLGATGAALFAIRPQFILTFGLFGLAYLLANRRRLFRRRALAQYAAVLAPWAIVLGFSVARHQRLTGHLGLISENGELNNVFAGTTVGKVEARWRAPNGARWFFQVEPPTKKYVGETEVVRVWGYLADPKVLGPIREAHLEGKSLAWRARRAVGNVALLWEVHGPWPENEPARAHPGLRKLLQVRFALGTRRLLLPLTILGLLLAKKRAPYVVAGAHLATLVVLSLFFFPEARYRGPYDPFMLVLGFAALARIYPRIRAWIVERERSN